MVKPFIARPTAILDKLASNLGLSDVSNVSHYRINGTVSQVDSIGFLETDF